MRRNWHWRWVVLVLLVIWASTGCAKRNGKPPGQEVERNQPLSATGRGGAADPAPDAAAAAVAGLNEQKAAGVADDQRWRALAFVPGQDGGFYFGTSQGFYQDTSPVKAATTPVAPGAQGGGGSSADTRTRVEPLLPGAVLGVVAHPAQPDRILVVDARGVLHQSDDRGLTWHDTGRGLPAGQAVRALAQSAGHPSSLYALLGENQVYRSGDGGQTWRPAGQTPAPVATVAVATADAEEVFAGADAGVWASRDGGWSWEKLQSAPASVRNLTAAHGRLYAATSHGIHESQDSGYTWGDHSTGLPDLNVRTLAARIDAADHLAVVLGNGEVYVRGAVADSATARSQPWLRVQQVTASNGD